MSDLPEKLTEQFRSFVALCPPTNILGINPSDDQRLTAFFVAANESGFVITAGLVGTIWPESTIAPHGDDPAKVPELKAMVLDKAEQWINEIRRGN